MSERWTTDRLSSDRLAADSGTTAPAAQVSFGYAEAGVGRAVAHRSRAAKRATPRATRRASGTAPGTPSAPLVMQADAVEWLKTIETASVDLIVTDPAYESLEKHRARGTTTRLKHSKASSNDWFQIFPNARFPELFAEAYRVLKNDRHFYLFCDQETMFAVKPLAEAQGFKFWKPLIWDKRRIGMGYHYRSRYELILFFEKGKQRLNDLSVPDIIEHPRVHRGYPAEKPTEVSSVLIRQSTEPGALVIDPFSGSGSVGAAALSLGRRFLGCDICSEAVQVACKRLASALDESSAPMAASPYRKISDDPGT